MLPRRYSTLPADLGTRARKLDPLVSPRQSRHKCICGRLLQNQHHERVTDVDTALKTILAVLTTARPSRLRRSDTRRSASTLSTTLHVLTTWPLPGELPRSRRRTITKDIRGWKTAL